MIFTIDYIRQRFAAFNHQIFAGRLPTPPVELTDAASFVGKCIFNQQRQPDGLMVYSDLSLRFSTRFDLQEREADDVIIHEMIHYFILWNGLHDTAPHGVVFKSLMASINSAHGRNITISHRMTPEQKSAAKRSKCHIVASLHFTSGETAVKVLTNNVSKIEHYYKAASRTKGVREVKIWLSDNQFFSRYPTSASLRYHLVDPQLLADNLIGARQLQFKNGRLIIPQ